MVCHQLISWPWQALLPCRQEVTWSDVLTPLPSWVLMVHRPGGPPGTLWWYPALTALVSLNTLTLDIPQVPVSHTKEILSVPVFSYSSVAAIRTRPEICRNSSVPTWYHLYEGLATPSTLTEHAQPQFLPAPAAETIWKLPCTWLAWCIRSSGYNDPRQCYNIFHSCLNYLQP